MLKVLPYCRRFKIYTNEKLVSLGMTAMFVSQLIISLIVLVLAILILSGKGDNLIAGYNTATKRERNLQYQKSPYLYRWNVGCSVSVNVAICRQFCCSDSSCASSFNSFHRTGQYLGQEVTDILFV